MAQHAESIKEKTDKFDYKKIKKLRKFLHGKDTISKERMKNR